jgi:hypothetical protein
VSEIVEAGVDIQDRFSSFLSEKPMAWTRKSSVRPSLRRQRGEGGVDRRGMSDDVAVDQDMLDRRLVAASGRTRRFQRLALMR